MNKLIIDRIVNELNTNPEVYLKSCKSNYIEYIEAAKILLPEYYSEIKKSDSNLSVIQDSLNFKQLGDFESELNILDKLYSLGTDIPYVYHRLIIIYKKKKEFEKAYIICQKWFDSIYWKVPNMATTSLKILTQMQQLSVRLGR